MPETTYEKRLRQENTCYNPELDLWNNTQLSKLERESQARLLMEKLDAKTTCS